MRIIEPELSKSYLRKKKLLANRWYRKAAGVKNKKAELAKAKLDYFEKLYKSQNISVVNTHAPFGYEFFAQLKPRVSFKLINTLHGHYELLSKQWQNSKGRYDTFLANHIHLIDEFIYTTKDQCRTLESIGIDKNRMTKIYYGYEMPNTPADKSLSEPVQLVLVSRAIQEKGWKEAIQAVVKINSEEKKVVLTLVGSGPVYQDLFEMYKTRDDLRFEGHQDDTLKYLQNEHIGLLPTYYEAESFPNTIIEYLSAGLPVISSRIGAIEEMVESEFGLAGILLDTQRGRPVVVEDLANAIRELSNPERYPKDVKKAYAAADKFKIEIAVKGYCQLFSSN